MPNSKNDLSNPQKILKPRIKALAYISVTSSFGILLWSVLAKIPLNSNGIAFIIPAYQIETLVSPSNGRVFLLSPEFSEKIVELQQKNKDLVDGIKQNLSTSSVNPHSSFVPDQLLAKRAEAIDNAQDFLNSLIHHNGLNDHSNSQNQQIHKPQEGLTAQDELISKRNNILLKSASKDNCYSKGAPIFFVENSSNIAPVIDRMNDAKSSLSKFISRNQRLKSQYDSEKKRSTALYQRLQKAKLLESKGILTDDKVLQLEGEYLTSQNSSREIANELQNLNISSVEAFVHLRSEYKKFSAASILTSQHKTCILQQISSNGSSVDANNILAIAHNIESVASKNPAIIPFFYQASADRGIRNGSKVVFYPSNVPKNIYGGISGKVNQSGRVLVDKTAAHWILGFRDLKPFDQSSTNTVFYGLLELDIDSSNTSGYKWTSGDGPQFPLLLGSKGSVDVTVSSSTPISYVLPFLRKVTGQ